MKPLYLEFLLHWGAVSASETFDYVIAGAGTCGLVLANRLSENPNVRVAVVEVGNDERHNPNVTDITRFTYALSTPLAWQYPSVPQPWAGNKSVVFFGGKAIGGTSTINGMTYIRGDKAEFDAWEALGNEGWNWNSLYPYFKKVERFTHPTAAQVASGASYDAKAHGDSGPLRTGFPFQLINGTLYETIRTSWRNLGLPINPDVNSGDVRGFSVWPQTVDRDAGVRADAARAFLHPVEDRPNLSIIQGAVKKITWSDSVSTCGNSIADGVEYLTTKGETATYGLETKIELPGVGENLQDQPLLSLLYPGKLNASGLTPYATFTNVHDLFGRDSVSIAASTKVSLSQWARTVSDANNGAISPQILERLFAIQHDLIFTRNITIAETLTVASGAQLVSVFWLLLPFSRGSVHIKPSRAIEEPDIDPKFFLIDFDLDLELRTGRLAQQFWDTEPVKALVAPGEPALANNASEAEWAAYIRKTCLST
ncbi:hypothetical protein DL770_010512 [Monosporascus sp. CRB-9-2]|nr:hypothetical protein DL770_010512 [Monosporascus sp. CRB-9-2]